jgi:hypothetical protein
LKCSCVNPVNALNFFSLSLYFIYFMAQR